MPTDRSTDWATDVIRTWAHNERQGAADIDRALEALCGRAGKLRKAVKLLALNMDSVADAKAEVKVLAIAVARELERTKPEQWDERHLVQGTKHAAIDFARKVTADAARAEGLRPGNTGRLRDEDYVALRIATEARRGQKAEPTDGGMDDLWERLDRADCLDCVGHVVLRCDGIPDSVAQRAQEFLDSAAPLMLDRSAAPWVWFHSVEGVGGFHRHDLRFYLLMLRECFPEYLEAVRRGDPTGILPALHRACPGGSGNLVWHLFAGAERVFTRRLRCVLPKRVRQCLTKEQVHELTDIVLHPRHTFGDIPYTEVDRLDDLGIPPKLCFTLWNVVHEELEEHERVRWDVTAERLGYTSRRLRQFRADVAEEVRARLWRHLARHGVSLDLPHPTDYPGTALARSVAPGHVRPALSSSGRAPGVCGSGG